jgi:oxaloacetate decarboxylase alpha subunit
VPFEAKESKMVTSEKEIQFIDTTVRDGNQSLWDATGLTTAMILSIAPVMDRVGFKAVDFITGTMMAVSVRWHKENPWEKIRLVCKAMPKTPLSFGGTGRRFMGWKRVPESVMALALKLVIDSGIRRVWLLDPSVDIDFILRHAKLTKQAGAEEFVVPLSYTISPVHTDEFYAQKAAEIAASPDVDGIYIKDQGGLLTVDRIRTLVPAIQQRINGLPLEIHSHCNTGLAPLVYLEAIQLGVRIVHTAISPLANGTSQPSTENIIKNVRRLGYTTNLNEEALEAMATHFRDIAEREGRPLGAPVEYDVYYYEHQVPGGMMTTLKRQLAEVKIEHRLEDVLKEVVRVRRELGYPIMVTPFSQFVGSQATMNVISGERYKQVPTQVIEYIAGYYGQPPAPIDQNILDRISSLPQAKGILNTEPIEPSISELRQKIGSGISDEEFLIRLALPSSEVDDMFAAGPIKTNYP